MSLAAGLSVFVIVVVGAAWYFQGKVLKSTRHSTIGGRGQRVNRWRLGRWRFPGRALLIGYVLVAAVLPLLALLLVSLNRFWSPDINWMGLSLEMFGHVLFADPATSQSLRDSLLLGTVGATLGIGLAATITLYTQRATGALSRVLDAVIKLPGAISATVLAVGFILAFSGPPFQPQRHIAHCADGLPAASVGRG